MFELDANTLAAIAGTAATAVIVVVALIAASGLGR